jgi:hypothetical protein
MGGGEVMCEHEFKRFTNLNYPGFRLVCVKCHKTQREIDIERQWVKCDDRLPDNCCSCFIWHISKEFGSSCISAHYNSIKKTFGHEERFGGKTTHWMPMPDAPKEGE